MTSAQPRRRAWRILIAVVSLAVAASLTDLHGYGQELASHGPWQIGVFAAGGFPPNYEAHSGGSNPIAVGLQLDLLSAGVQIGRMLSGPPRMGAPARARGSGCRGYAILDCALSFAESPLLLPTLWVRRVTTSGRDKTYLELSITPLLFRWNFRERASRRSVTWAQLGGGLLWTNHKFPVPNPLMTESTSVINFTPQGAIGKSIFIKKNRSLDFALKAIHISNAGLGNENPGLDITLQFSAGYSWWR